MENKMFLNILTPMGKTGKFSLQRGFVNTKKHVRRKGYVCLLHITISIENPNWLGQVCVERDNTEM
jgi:hypothetical protein